LDILANLRVKELWGKGNRGRPPKRRIPTETTKGKGKRRIAR